MTEKTCAQLISDRLSKRIDQFLPDFESMDLTDCKRFLESLGVSEPDDSHLYYPSEHNPWLMNRQELIEALHYVGIESYDGETDDILRTAVIENMTDETIDGLEVWQDACRLVHENHSQEAILETSTYQLIRVELSTGGPADWFEFLILEGDIYSCTYVYQDWYDGARQNVSLEQADELARAFGIEHLFE